MALEATSPFEELPTELLLHIFSFLPRGEVERGTSAAAQVCRRWRCELLRGVPLKVPCELLGSDPKSKSALAECTAFVWNRARTLSVRVRDTHLDSLTEADVFAARRVLRLDISRTMFASVSLVSLCSNIQVLDLSYTAVRDVTPLAQVARSLTTLSLAGTKAEHLSTLLPQLLRLRSLDLHHTATTDADLECIDTLPNLAELNLAHTHVSRAPACPSLRVVVISHTAVASVEPLCACKDLQRLDISHTRVSRVWPLLWCCALEHLGSLGTEVSDLALMLKHPTLRTVSLPHTPVSDMYTLKNCPFLLYCATPGSIRVL